MKLLITTLTMIFISFGAKAYSVEQLYQDCKPFQNNGFYFDTLSPKKTKFAIMCGGYLKGLADRGYMNCKYLKTLHKKKLIDRNNFKIISSLTANSEYKINQVIISFINYAESNPQKWKYSPYNYTKYFIQNIFPCKLDE